MMRIGTMMLAGLLAALLTWSTTTAQADTLADIRARGKLLVAIDLGAPPYGTVDASMEPTGSDVEAARLLAADLGVKLEIVPATGANRIPFLQTNKVDLVMASFSITEERKKVVDFSIPYGVITVMCAAPAGVPITASADLKGRTVAVTRGTGADMDATKLSKAGPAFTIVRFDDDATLVTALASGQQTIMISAPAQMGEINRKAPGAKIEQKFVVRTNGYAAGIRKGDDTLRAYVNGWIEKGMADGTLRTAYKRFHGVDLPGAMPAG